MLISLIFVVRINIYNTDGVCKTASIVCQRKDVHISFSVWNGRFRFVSFRWVLRSWRWNFNSSAKTSSGLISFGFSSSLFKKFHKGSRKLKYKSPNSTMQLEVIRNLLAALFIFISWLTSKLCLLHVKISSKYPRSLHDLRMGQCSCL